MTGTSHRQSAGFSRRTLNLSLLAAAVTPACAAEGSGAAPARARLRRGLGVHHMMSLPALEEGSEHRFVWPPYQGPDDTSSDAELASIRAAGFDFVRLTAGPELFMATEGPRFAELLGIARGVVERFRRADLNVILDLHPTNNSPAYSPDRIVGQTNLFRRYAEITAALARTLGDMNDGGVVLELMNEPPVELAGRWREQTLTLAQAARAEASHLPLVVSGHNGGGYQELAEFDPLPAALGPLIYTFHYYEPGVFTHQTQIDAARYITGLEWPPQPGALANNVRNAERMIAADRSLNQRDRAYWRTDVREVLTRYYERNHNAETIAHHFGEVAAWADRHSIARENILVGEFGVVRTHWQYVGAKEPGRLAYLEAVRRASEDNGFAWSAWVYRGWGGMAITTFGNPMAFDPGTLRALGLRD